MATRAVKRARRDEGPGKNWPTLPERAPSIVRADEPTAGRVIALISLLLVAMGALAMIAPAVRWRYFIGPGPGFFFAALGIVGLFFHAFNERDQQFRRMYGVLGFLLFAVGALLRVDPFGAVMGGRFLPFGVPCLGLALVFL